MGLAADSSSETAEVRDDVSDGRYCIVVIAGAEVSTFSIPRRGRVVVGRGDCDVALLVESVSRRHAAIDGGDPPTIEDLGSRNGTAVGGEKLERGDRVALPAGSTVQLGSVLMVVQRVKEAQSDARVIGKLDTRVVACSPQMQELYRLVDLVAPSELPVLILGETGVGKEIVAERIHHRSRRAAGRFLRLNCAALPESVIESELFGYRKGAFTGATQAKMGLLEAADGGTLFLDEVGELPLVTQAKILRFLEAGEVLSVGSTQPIHVDARLISATNRDLGSRIQSGEFRSDLFFRLNGMTVTVPPLRERLEDVGPLAQFFLGRAADRVHESLPPVSAEAFARLQRHHWPGNVRELKNVMERAFVLGQHSEIRAEHLMLETSPAPAATSQSSPAPSGASGNPSRHDGGMLGTVRRYERQQIEDALDRAGGNQSRAARILGITRRQLLTRLDAYGIDRSRKNQ